MIASSDSHIDVTNVLTTVTGDPDPIEMPAVYGLLGTGDFYFLPKIIR
ncbi:hypothetical protein [Bartonella quintana]|nr:hypothetical protein [Bartonella quintana]